MAKQKSKKLSLDEMLRVARVVEGWEEHGRIGTEEGIWAFDHDRGIVAGMYKDKKGVYKFDIKSELPLYGGSLANADIVGVYEGKSPEVEKFFKGVMDRVKEKELAEQKDYTGFIRRNLGLEETGEPRFDLQEMLQLASLVDRWSCYDRNIRVRNRSFLGGVKGLPGGFTFKSYETPDVRLLRDSQNKSFEISVGGRDLIDQLNSGRDLSIGRHKGKEVELARLYDSVNRDFLKKRAKAREQALVAVRSLLSMEDPQ